MSEQYDKQGLGQSTEEIEDPCVWREIEIDATPEDVWESVATEEGRERWLEPARERDLQVTESEAPHRIVWSWSDTDDEPERRVELLIVAIPAGSRVIVIESAPSLPLSMLACAVTAGTPLALA